MIKSKILGYIALFLEIAFPLLIVYGLLKS